jgi:hypothetical protein
MDDEMIYKSEEKVKLYAQSSLPLALIGLGLVLLAANVLGFSFGSILWPGFIIGPGLLLLWPTIISTPERPNALSFLAVPGAVVTMVGLLLFVMNLTNHFEAWAYSWTLVVMAGAWGLSYAKRHDVDNKIHASTRSFMRVMAYLFIGFAIFFELLVFGSMTFWLPMLLIVGGVYLLLRNR